MQDTLQSTRMLLTDWARHVRGQMPRAWAKSSAFVNAGSGGRGEDHSDLPEHVLAIDKVICRAPAEHREILLMDYVHGVGLWIEDKAARLRYTRWSYRRALREAERYVDTELNR